MTLCYSRCGPIAVAALLCGPIVVACLRRCGPIASCRTALDTAAATVIHGNATRVGLWRYAGLSGLLHAGWFVWIGAGVGAEACAVYAVYAVYVVYADCGVYFIYVVCAM